MKYTMLKEVCSIKMGQSPASDSYNDNGKGVPFFQGNADFGERYPVARKWCSAPLKMAEPEDILISVRAPIGALNYAKEECCIGRGLAALTPNKSKVSPEFMFWLLKGKNTELNSKGTGSTFKAIGRKVLEEILVPDIGIEQQAEYSAILEKINGIIQLRKHELQKLDELIKARFIELFGDPIVNSMSWPEELIGDSCFVTKLAGFEYTQYIHYKDSGDVVMVKAQNVKNGKLNRKDLSYISKAVSDSLPRSQLLAGDVVMTYVGANIGDVAVIDDKYKYHLAPNVAKIRPNAEKYNSIYFMYMLMFLNSYIVGNSADTAKAALGMERIRKLKIFVPPIELQEQFAAFVEQVDKSKVAIQKSLEKTQLLFDSLMQKYFG